MPWASSGSQLSRNSGLLSRSGLTSRTSTSPAASRARTSCHSVTLPELTVWARTPARAAASTWLRMSDSSGLTMTVGPGPGGAQQRGGHEVHGRLAPAGALDDEHAGPLDEQRPDGLELVLAEVGVLAGGEPAQDRRAPGSSRVAGSTRGAAVAEAGGTSRTLRGTPDTAGRPAPDWATGCGRPGCGRPGCGRPGRRRRARRAGRTGADGGGLTGCGGGALTAGVSAQAAPRLAPPRPRAGAAARR